MTNKNIKASRQQTAGHGNQIEEKRNLCWMSNQLSKMTNKDIKASRKHTSGHGNQIQEKIIMESDISWCWSF